MDSSVPNAELSGVALEDDFPIPAHPVLPCSPCSFLPTHSSLHSPSSLAKNKRKERGNGAELLGCTSEEHEAVQHCSAWGGFTPLYYMLTTEPMISMSTCHCLSTELNTCCYAMAGTADLCRTSLFLSWPGEVWPGGSLVALIQSRRHQPILPLQLFPQSLLSFHHCSLHKGTHLCYASENPFALVSLFTLIFPLDLN